MVRDLHDWPAVRDVERYSPVQQEHRVVRNEEPKGKTRSIVSDSTWVLV